MIGESVRGPRLFLKKPAALEDLISTILDGKVDGSAPEGWCACGLVSLSDLHLPGRSSEEGCAC